MHQVMRSFARLFAMLWVMYAWGGAALADYPDYTSSPPPGMADRPQARAANSPAEGSGLPVESAATRAAGPLRFPLRQGADRHSGVPHVLDSDGARAPQRLAAQERAIQLTPRSSESKPGQRGVDMPHLLTGAGSLGIVLGLFLLVAWVMRRGMPKTPMLLPREAVAILGRAPLAGRQQVHLVRCGNKVLLLNVSAANVETLTEITDPAEVERLEEICRQAGANKMSVSFRQVFGQIGRQRGPEYLPGREDDALDFAHLEALGQERAREAHAY